MIAVHGYIMFSEKIGFDHSINSIIFFCTDNIILHYFLMHMQRFADFQRKELPRRQLFCL